MNNQDTYFVADAEGKIKIGRTYSIWERLGQFQRERGGKITLLAIIPDDRIELELHHKFEHLRIEGEWYEPGLDLLAFIKELDYEPMTLSEFKEAKKKLGWGFSIMDHPCITCGTYIPWNHLYYPDFDYRYEYYYRHDNFICLYCYRPAFRCTHLCNRLVRASVTYPLNWPKIWRMEEELGQLMSGEKGHPLVPSLTTDYQLTLPTT